VTKRPGQARLVIVPLTFRQGCRWVAEHHRHNPPPAGMRRVVDLPARAGWADSSVALCALRDPVGTGGVERTLWAVGDAMPVEERGA
jgi:hypothetical protein